MIRLKEVEFLPQYEDIRNPMSGYLLEKILYLVSKTFKIVTRQALKNALLTVTERIISY